MEATNISIKQQSSVSINVETLQAIKQRVLSAVAKLSIFRSTSGRSQGENFQFSIWRIYRHQLRLARTVAAWCDRHNTLVNWLMAIQVMVFALYVFLFV